MTDVQPPVAMAAAEAAWYERAGIDPREAWQAGAHAGWQAGWAAALQWAAQLADDRRAGYVVLDPQRGGEWHPFASLLRQEGGGT